MATFVTHPSIRIKGTENNFNPVPCVDAACIRKQGHHMHCPFCVSVEAFVDPVILKAHYRVKHVDKGLDFAGLKILRCCDHCDIVGAIKGEKHFKGAHWHCYKCRNGFNRRDEALKHYKTHFRNPQTTFQIQVTQEVNQMFTISKEAAEAVEVLNSEGVMHSTITQAVMGTGSDDNSLDMGSDCESNTSDTKVSVGEVHVSVAANETVGTSEGQTIMIIQEEPVENSHDHMMGKETMQITSCESLDYSLMLEQKLQLESELGELRHQYQQLEFEKSQMEQTLQAEVDQLKLQVQMQSAELTSYQKREHELLAQLSMPLDSRIQQLLMQLGAEHQQLLHQQLAVLKQTCQEVSAEVNPDISADLLSNQSAAATKHQYSNASSTITLTNAQAHEVINCDQSDVLNSNANVGPTTTVTYVMQSAKYDDMESNSVIAQRCEENSQNMKRKIDDNEHEFQPLKKKKES